MMQVGKFFSKFDIDKFKSVLKVTLIIFALVIIVNVVGLTYSRYESGANITADANIAFFVVDTTIYESSIVIDGLTPREEPFIYTFNVSNFKNNNVAGVDIKYHITFTATTNLPLTYEIYRNESYGENATNIISNEELIQDDNDVYYKKFETANDFVFSYSTRQTDQYTLAVWYPEEYQNNPDDYSGAVDMFTIRIYAEQVV